MKIIDLMRATVFIFFVSFVSMSFMHASQGSYCWTKRIGGTVLDNCSCITTDPSDNVYLTGRFEGTVNFGADFGTVDSKISIGDWDIFLTKLTVHLPIVDGHDFDGNNRADASIWRPSNGRFYIKGIGNHVWGTLGDIPANGDYNGDGTTDIAVWRPSNGRWYIRGMAGSVWGTAGDIPAPGDYNGDGKTDIAVWRPMNGRWYVKGLAGYIWGMLGGCPFGTISLHV